MSIRVYWNKARGYFDVDIITRTPDGTNHRERRRSPVQTESGALAWAKKRAAFLALNGPVRQIAQRPPSWRKPSEKVAHDERTLTEWLADPDADWGGWVYFVRGPSGSIKIGWATDVRARLAELQTGCPDPHFLLGMRRGAVAHEKLLHRQFRTAHVRGEWFSPTTELEGFIQQCAPLKTLGDSVDPIAQKGGL